MVPSGPKAGDRTALLLPGGVQVIFAWCPPGTFLMGSENGEDDEKPVHRVTLTKGFYLGVYPVTQAQWMAVMGVNPSQFKGDARPVECISWNDTGVFAAKLKELTGKPIRLPSEAEWEYACRAGTMTEYHTGDGEAALKRAGWYKDNSGFHTHPVGELAANGWGLHDMHGNVWEWCQDGYGPYVGGDQIDPLAQTIKNSLVLRGGSWDGNPFICRAASRNCLAPAYYFIYFGFRVAFHLD